ncbi:MAG: proteasome accessory factor PafA2 family protein [Deltaproteobacteria bacterium]|nr:proteasome accessory factor PafA2 family protein [Deltaproteobacteria bacterium]
MEKSEENIEEKSNRKSKKKGKRTYHGRVIGRDRSRYARPEQPREAPRRVAKICGSDYELANFVLNDEDRDGTGHQASRALLEKIEGKSPAARWSGTGSGSWGSGSGSYSVQEGSSGVVYTDYTNYTSYASAYSGTDAQDWGRKYHENGGCTYIDLCHLEICIPEVRSAWDHVAANRAMLEIAARAQASLNAELPEDRRIEVLANNSDGRGHSYPHARSLERHLLQQDSKDAGAGELSSQLDRLRRSGKGGRRERPTLGSLPDIATGRLHGDTDGSPDHL